MRSSQSVDAVDKPYWSHSGHGGIKFYPEKFSRHRANSKKPAFDNEAYFSSGSSLIAT